MKNKYTNKPKRIPKQIKEYLSYNKKTGDLIWSKSPSSNIKKGTIAGSESKKGYIRIRFKGLQYPAHRIAWFIFYGEEPIEIDHINTIRNQNNIENLRSCTHSENGKNKGMFKNNTSGFKGVSWHKQSKKWQATIRVNSKLIHLGCYKKKKKAAEKRAIAENKHFGKFAFNQRKKS